MGLLKQRQQSWNFSCEETLCVYIEKHSLDLYGGNRLPYTPAFSYSGSSTSVLIFLQSNDSYVPLHYVSVYSVLAYSVSKCMKEKQRHGHGKQSPRHVMFASLSSFCRIHQIFLSLFHIIFGLFGRIANLPNVFLLLAD
jgi:hypothetical protein